MQLPQPPQRGQGDDGLIPLINIVFLLLIFFMLAGALSRPDPLEISPPTSADGAPAAVDEAVLSLAADGRLALDDAPLERAALTGALTRLLEQSDELRLKLKADAAVEAELLLPLLDELRAAGVERLTLLTVAGG